LLPAGAPSFLGRTKQQGLQRPSFDVGGHNLGGENHAQNETRTPSQRSRSHKPITIESTEDSGSDGDSASAQTTHTPAAVRRGTLEPAPSITPKLNVKNKGHSARTFILSGGSSAAPISKTPTRTSARSEERGTLPKPEVRKKISENITDNDGDELALPTSQKKQASSTQKRVVDSTEDEDLNYSIRSSQRQRRTAVIISDDDESDKELPEISKLSALSGRQQKQPAGVAIESNTKEDEDEDDDEPILSSPNKKRRRISTEDEDMDTGIVMSPTKRLRRSSQFQSVDRPVEVAKRETHQRQTRQSQGKKRRTERQKNMELLRRKRAGENITELTPSGSEDDEPRGGLYDSDSELEVLDEFEDEEVDEEEERMEQVRQSIRAVNRNEYEDDFVVEDDDEPIGVPEYGLHSIPLEFTHHAHKPLKEHFKDAVEWMVHRKVSQTFSATLQLQEMLFFRWIELTALDQPSIRPE
jgi:hypothetical protein